MFLQTALPTKVYWEIKKQVNLQDVASMWQGYAQDLGGGGGFGGPLYS